MFPKKREKKTNKLLFNERLAERQFTYAMSGDHDFFLFSLERSIVYMYILCRK